MTITSQKSGPEQNQTKNAVIDVDVHESMTSIHDLLPYLPEPYYSRVAIADGWKEPTFPYAYPMINGVAMAEAVIDDGRPAGSDFEKMKRDLLDAHNIEAAILTGSFYPSDMRVQPHFASALASAYNDWQIEHWLSKDDRLRGSVCIALQDPVAAAREIDRIGSHPQVVQIITSVIPYDVIGKPIYHPIYEAAVRNDLVFALHQGNFTETAVGLPPYYIEWHTAIFQNWQSQLISLVAHGVFDQFPELRVALIESGWTWMPSLMWRFDHNFRSVRRDTPWVKKMPSEHIRHNVRVATQPMEYPEDARQVYQMFEMIGSDEFLMFATDYPHWDFDAPTKAIPHTFPKDVRQKILYDNAKAFYRL